jgi:hypothetical protein
VSTEAEASPLFDLRTRSRAAARAVAQIALKGLPTVRAAMHGARLGAGRAFAPAVIEQLGFRVVPSSARAVAQGIARTADEMALVVRRGRSFFRAGAHGLTLHGREGLALNVSARGSAAATVSSDAVQAVARTTTRGAVAGIGRAALGGAAAGAVIDGGIAGIQAAMAVRRGEIAPREAVRHVGIYAARGAVAGAAGVAAAGVVSAGMAATGLAIVGAPVAVPFAAMLAVGAIASRAFDRRFGTR